MLILALDGEIRRKNPLESPKDICTTNARLSIRTNVQLLPDSECPMTIRD